MGTARRYRKINGVLRYSQGDRVNGLSVTGMGYRRDLGLDRPDTGAGGCRRVIGPIRRDRSHGWRRHRIATADRSSGSARTETPRRRVTAYGIGYDLNLFSNFTFFLDDPVRGDQFQQADHRFVTGAQAHPSPARCWGGRPVQNTFGVQLRNDDITNVGLYHTQARAALDTVRQDAVLQTSAAATSQNETAWTPWLRTLAGLRADGYRFDVTSSNPLNSGVARAGLVSPKGGVVVGPWKGTELYVNAGLGFHSNDARGATITVRSGRPAGRPSG